MKKGNKRPAKPQAKKGAFLMLLYILRKAKVRIFPKTKKKKASTPPPVKTTTPPPYTPKPKEKSIINKDLYHVNKASFLSKFLSTFFVIQNILMALYLYAYLIGSDSYQQLLQTDGLSFLTFGVMMFFLVAIFNMFMQIGLKSSLPKSTFGMLSLILPSYIFVGYRYFKYQVSIEQTIIDFAFVDTASIMATFLLLIILVMASPEKRNLKACLAQIFFIYPAIATIYFYLDVNYQLSGSSSFAKSCFPYALIILANVSILFKSMKEASIYGSKYSKKPI